MLWLLDQLVATAAEQFLGVLVGRDEAPPIDIVNQDRFRGLLDQEAEPLLAGAEAFLGLSTRGGVAHDGYDDCGMVKLHIPN